MDSQEELELQKLTLEREKIKLESKKTGIAFWSVVLALATSIGSLVVSSGQARVSAEGNRQDLMQRKFEDVQKQVSTGDPVVKIAAMESLSVLGRERIGAPSVRGTDDEFREVPYFRQASKLFSVVSLEVNPLVTEASTIGGWELLRFAEKQNFPRLAKWALGHWDTALDIAQRDRDIEVRRMCKSAGLLDSQGEPKELEYFRKFARNIAFNQEYMGILPGFQYRIFDAETMILNDITHESYVNLMAKYLHGVCTNSTIFYPKIYSRPSLLPEGVTKDVGAAPPALRNPLDSHSVYQYRDIQFGVRGNFLKALLVVTTSPNSKYTATLIQKDLSGQDLELLNLKGALLSACRLIGSIFGTRLTKAEFFVCDLQGARFNKSDLSGTKIVGGNVDGAVFFKCSALPSIKGASGRYTVVDVSGKKSNHRGDRK